MKAEEDAHAFKLKTSFFNTKDVCQKDTITLRADFRNILHHNHCAFKHLIVH